VLAAVDEDSELVDIVTAANCGAAIPPDNADALEAAIRRAYAERETYREYGLNGRRHAEAHYSRHAVSQQYHALIHELTGNQTLSSVQT